MDKRYFAGKGQEDSDSDSDESVHSVIEQVDEPPSAPAPVVVSREPEQSEDSSDESEDSDSDSDDSFEESSEDEPVVMHKPVFLSKNQRSSSKPAQKEEAADPRDKERALDAIEKGIVIQTEEEKRRAKEESWQGEEDVGDLDDTDYPEKDAEEYALWRERELQRLREDHQRLIQREVEREKNE